MPDANRNAIEHVQHNQIINASYEGRVFCDKWESIKEYIRLNNHIPRDEYNRYIRPLSYCGYVGYTQFICVPDSLATEIGVYIGEINKISATVEPLGRTFYINFVEVIDSLELKNNLLHNKIIELCKPGNLEEYVKCYGFKHSTGAWENNAEVLLKEGIVSFDELIANREDVYEYLLDLGVDKPMAFTIAEYVRMGKVKKQGWKEEMYTVMKSKDIPEWFIKSCEKVDYLFTRAHAISLYKSYTDL